LSRIKKSATAAEEEMKAALALILIYIGTFLVAIQSSSSGSVEASSQAAASKPAAIDPAKDTDIRALLELVGARDLVQDSVKASAEQYREKLIASVADNEKGQALASEVINLYEKKFDVDRVNEQLVAVYDKHYTAEEIKGLLQFYGSPLGQKVAAEAPRISREIQEVTRVTASKAVREATAQAKLNNPGTAENVHLGNGGGQRRLQQRAQAMPTASQPQTTPQQAAEKLDQ
jgi:hypothetical protein